jgi:hypothetical protein
MLGMPTCMIAMRSVSTAVDVALVAHIAIAVLQSAGGIQLNFAKVRNVIGVSGKL